MLRIKADCKDMEGNDTIIWKGNTCQAEAIQSLNRCYIKFPLIYRQLCDAVRYYEF
jgi:hypothetical protein